MVDVRRRGVDPVPKRAIYSIMCILFFDDKSVQYVSKQWYGMSKGYLLKKMASKKDTCISVFLAIIHQQQKTRCTRLRCPRLDCPPAC